MRGGRALVAAVVSRKLCLKSRVSRWEIWILAGLPRMLYTYVCVCACVYVCTLVQGGSVSYAQEWAVGANITGVWLPRDYRRAALFHPFPYYSRPRERHHLRRRHRPPRGGLSLRARSARSPKIPWNFNAESLLRARRAGCVLIWAPGLGPGRRERDTWREIIWNTLYQNMSLNPWTCEFFYQTYTQNLQKHYSLFK